MKSLDVGHVKCRKGAFCRTTVRTVVIKHAGDLFQ